MYRKRQTHKSRKSTEICERGTLRLTIQDRVHGLGFDKPPSATNSVIHQQPPRVGEGWVGKEVRVEGQHLWLLEGKQEGERDQ